MTYLKNKVTTKDAKLAETDEASLVLNLRGLRVLRSHPFSAIFILNVGMSRQPQGH